MRIGMHTRITIVGTQMASLSMKNRTKTRTSLYGL